jgi:hypothetical protein
MLDPRLRPLADVLVELVLRDLERESDACRPADSDSVEDEHAESPAKPG